MEENSGKFGRAIVRYLKRALGYLDPVTALWSYQIC